MSKKAKPDFRELRELAIERHEIAKHAFSQCWFNSAFGDYHFSLELIMKSAVYKNGGLPPSTAKLGHDLVEISKSMLFGATVKNLHRAIVSDKTIVTLWNNINSAWDANKRYQYIVFDPLDVDELANTYERIFRWIQVNYVD